MPYETEEKLKSYLDSNQQHREQMCTAILAIDKRYSDVQPRHPKGGPDGGRDIQASFRKDQSTFGAVGFINGANDSKEHKTKIKTKFSEDLSSALRNSESLDRFIFFTNISLTSGEKELLIKKAQKRSLSCEIFDRERLRLSLDTVDGFSIRFQYLGIPLSEEEQASFFARWGEDIQSVIATGFQKVDHKLDRILFLNESNDSLKDLFVRFELKESYPSEEIDHFRLFCNLYLKEPKNKVFSVIFGSSDKSDRMLTHKGRNFRQQKSGIKHGISGAQWEQYLEPENPESGYTKEDFTENYTRTSSSTMIGKDSCKFIYINYSVDHFYRLWPTLKLRDLDEAKFVLISNKSLASKIESIHIYANEYKLREIKESEFRVNESDFDFDFKADIPPEFTDEELLDPWVRIFPFDGSSYFEFQFFEETPNRIVDFVKTKDSLKS